MFDIPPIEYQARNNVGIPLFKFRCGVTTYSNSVALGGLSRKGTMLRSLN